MEVSTENLESVKPVKLIREKKQMSLGLLNQNRA